MIKKTIILLVLYFFAVLPYSLRGKEYFAQELEPVGAGCFWPLGAGAGATRKKIPGARAGAAWEKNQEPEPLEKKSGAGAVKKFAGSPALNPAITFTAKGAHF